MDAPMPFAPPVIIAVWPGRERRRGGFLGIVVIVIVFGVW